MYICVDAHYSPTETIAAGIVFKNIASDRIEKEYIRRAGPAEKYQPCQFYLRELPVLVDLLKDVAFTLQTIIIDGYVWLSPDRKPGLGAYLFAALDEHIPIIGVAKNPYRDISMARKVFRGRSSHPLYITAAGMKEERAASLIEHMHGRYRIPTLLKHVDAISRKGFSPTS